MGAALFTAIVNAFVENIITPIIVVVSGNSTILDLTVQIGGATLTYGLFLQAVTAFLIIALVLFMIIKFINQLVRKKEAVSETDVIAPTVEFYLKEIRDPLAQQSNDTTKDSNITSK